MATVEASSGDARSDDGSNDAASTAHTVETPPVQDDANIDATELPTLLQGGLPANAKRPGERRAILALAGPVAGTGVESGRLRSSLRMSLSGAAPEIKTYITGTASSDLSLMSSEVREEAEFQEEEDARNQLDALASVEIVRDELATMSVSVSCKAVHFSVKAIDPDDLLGKRLVDKTILQNCWAHFEAGSLVAFMGPSGCGKTTFMDILARKKTGKYDGCVYMNGLELDDMYQRISSYVGQQDLIPPHWTVSEAIAFNAVLKKPKPTGVRWEHFHDYLDVLLEDVGLLHIKGSSIGGSAKKGISGGQLRRVSLACGIAHRPGLLFCDEPTSGLSATDAELCVRTLWGLTRRWNTTVFAVIHQPRRTAAKLFDHLVLLTSRPGRIVYNGPMNDATAYWQQLGYPVPESVNPTDHFLDTVSPGAPIAAPEVFSQHYDVHELPKVMERVEVVLGDPGQTPMMMLELERTMYLRFGALPRVRRSVFGVGFAMQFRALLRRKAQFFLRDRKVFGIVVGMSIFTGILFGCIFQGVGTKEPRGLAQMPFLFMLMVSITVRSNSLMPAMIDERTIMNIEVNEALYSLGAHILAQSVVDMLTSLVGKTLYLFIMYAFSQLDWNRFGSLYFWCITLSFPMEALCLAIGAAAKNMPAAQAIALGPQILFLIFSGFVNNRLSSPEHLKWLLSVSPVSWVYEMTCFEQFGDDSSAWSDLQTLYGFEKPSRPICFGVNVGIFALFRLFQVLSLRFLNKGEK